jgi:UDP-2,4-diacetamido-2,4,6-trideoxy-beta-L-altropyranose hydrolase
MGAGHLQRCMTLADALRERGAHSTFVCRSLPEQFDGTLANKGHDLIRLGPAGETPVQESTPPHAAWLGTSQHEDARQTAAALRQAHPDWLVADHYALDVRWERAMRPFARHILVIDDLADRPHDCDLLLDQNFYADLRERYVGRVGKDSRQLLGPRYALLRSGFARARSGTRERDGEVRRVLVFFGGADADNYTGLTLEALSGLGRPDLAVDVVVGLMNPHAVQLEALCAARPNTRFFRQTEDMPRLMAEADLAIGAGGGATWERCCLGLPTLAVVVADNQRRMLHDLCEAATVVCPSGESVAELRGQLSASIAAMLSSKSFLRGMSRRCMELVDGAGANRVVGAMLGMDVTLRRATEADCEPVYEWRSHPDIRQSSLQQDVIAHSDHVAWYAATLRNPDRALLIVEAGDRAVAVVRFDLEGARATVSIYLVPGELTGGWGTTVLQRSAAWLRQHHPGVREIVAEVLPGNRASRGAFLQAGYRELKVTFVRSLAEP